MVRRALDVFFSAGAACLLAACSLAACGGAEEAPPVSEYAALESAIAEEVRTGGIVGLGAALIKDDQVAWIGTYGYADLEARREIDEDTPFNVASISKTVASVVMMQLAEKGALELDAPIDVPLGFAPRHPNYPDTPITARMLATHTSAIVDDWITLGQVTVDGADSPIPLGAFARTYTEDPEHFGRQPGTRHVYSNSGIGILGAVIEGAAGDRLPALAQRDVFAPLGMTHSGYLLSEHALESLAVPYSGRRQDGAVRSEHQGYAFYPATSLRTSIRDLSRFLLSFMRFGATEDGGHILAHDTAASMRAIQNPELDETQGIVWYRDSVGKYQMFGHTGSAVGFSAIMFFDPQTGVGVIVLTNSDAFIRARLGDPSSSTALYKIAERIVDEAMKP